MVFLLPLRLTHKTHCFLLLHHAQLVPVQDLQLLQFAQDSHFVIGLVRCRVVEEVEVPHRGQNLQMTDDGIEISQLVVVQDQSFDVPELGEDSFYRPQLVILKEEVLQPEIFL